MTDDSKKNEHAEEAQNSTEKKVKKKVWVPGKDGRFTAEIQERTIIEPDPEEAQGSDEGSEVVGRVAAEEARRQYERRKKPDQDQKRPKERPKREAFQPQHQIQSIYTMHMSRSNPQRMLQTLGETEISVVIDMRPNAAMYAPGLVKPRDLAILLKETAGIDYRREEVLVPGLELVRRLENDGNWSRFRDAYLRQLSRIRVEEILDESYFARNKVVLLGVSRDPEKDMRGLLAGYLQTVWNINSVHHL